MRQVATGLLVCMAALYALARTLEPRHPAWGFVRAFAEAAMVGGLADWFAVTALFRHPLGLPIPHTAIIPRNKDRIGDSLAGFLRTNFLTPAIVARRMRGLDVAAAVGRFLARPAAAGGRLGEGAGRLAAGLLEALDRERLGGMARAGITARLDRIEIAPLLGRLLEAAMREGRHVPVLTGMIGWASRTLAANEALIRAMIHERAGSVLRWTGLDEALANRIIDGLDKLLADMADDPAHAVRIRADEALERLAANLQHDPELRARVEAAKRELLRHPAALAWIDGLWEGARVALIRLARDPGRAQNGQLGDALRQIGAALQADPRLNRGVNSFMRRATVGGVSAYGDGIVRLVSDTIRKWDAGTVTARVENAVGADLQYIRINGTVVGGLVGVAIHTVATLV